MVEEALEHMQEAISYMERLVEELQHGEIGQELRVEVLESPEVLAAALRLIEEDQLWGSQIDSYGHKTGLYKPSTIAKKRKIPNYPPDKLVNYTEYWTGAFYREGIYIWADAASNRFEFDKTNRRPYFQYIPQEYIGLTDENYALWFSWADDLVRQRQKEYLKEKMIENGYGDYYFYLMGYSGGAGR